MGHYKNGTSEYEFEKDFHSRIKQKLTKPFQGRVMQMFRESFDLYLEHQKLISGCTRNNVVTQYIEPDYWLGVPQHFKYCWEQGDKLAFSIRENPEFLTLQETNESIPCVGWSIVAERL